MSGDEERERMEREADAITSRLAEPVYLAYRMLATYRMAVFTTRMTHEAAQTPEEKLVAIAEVAGAREAYALAARHCDETVKRFEAEMRKTVKSIVEDGA